MNGIIALFAGCLLAIGLVVRVLDPGQDEVAQAIFAVAALPVLALIAPGAWRALRSDDLHGVADLLVLVVAVAAWAAGDLLTAAAVPLALLAGHVVEERSLRGARSAIASLEGLRRARARRVLADGTIEEVDAAELRPGDLVDLPPGERVPADGRVREGRSHVASAAVTGESLPQAVAPGDAVVAGGVNHEGALRMLVERAGADTVLGSVERLLLDAEAVKPPAVRVLERFAGSYLPLVLVIAAAAGLATGSLSTALAVVVAACPCALALAAPATAVVAVAVAARRGVLLSAGAVLERLAAADCLLIDKTGTLTRGMLALDETRPAEGVDPAHLRAMAAAVAARSRHPVSRAVVDACPAHPLAESVTERAGLGVIGRVAGEEVLVGRAELLAEAGIAAGEAPGDGRPAVAVACGGRLLGWLVFSDPPRAEARAALAELRRLGLDRQVVLTGDRAGVALPVADAVGADACEAGLLPAGKLAAVRAELAAGRRPLVVGDGVNDALALRAGAVGVAMGRRAAGAALAASDAVLAADDLRRLPEIILLARAAGRALRTAIAVALAGTAVLVALAATGAIGPFLAALLHNAIGLAVVAVAGTLVGERRPAVVQPAQAAA